MIRRKTVHDVRLACFDGFLLSGPRIAYKNRDRNAAKKDKRRDVPIEKGFRNLRRIGLDEASIRLRQVEA